MVEQVETMPDGDSLTSVLLWKQTQIPARAVSLRDKIILSYSFSFLVSSNLPESYDLEDYHLSIVAKMITNQIPGDANS